LGRIPDKQELKAESHQLHEGWHLCRDEGMICSQLMWTVVHLVDAPAGLRLQHSMGWQMQTRGSLQHFSVAFAAFC